MSSAVLSKRGLERFKTRHPWVYRSDTLSLPREVGIHPVEDDRGRVLGYALVNAQSEISVRVLTYWKEASVDTLIERVHAALDYRESLQPDADSYRLIHAEADELPALVVDKYQDYLVVQNGSAALEIYLDDLLQVLIDRVQPRGILGRFENKNRELEGLSTENVVLYGEVPETIECREADVRYLVNPYTGQKTGAFLDQRENRTLLGQHARGNGLDVFSYHGSFALHLAGKCDALECIDVSEEALKRAEENMQLNGFHHVTFTVANAFDRLRELERSGIRFDTISLDPPAFAKRRKDLEAAYGAYKELNLRCMKLLNPGGVLASSSCSFHVSDSDFYEMLGDAARDAGRRFRILDRRTQAPDHPEMLGVPETRYLKFALLQAMD
ncbi:class I SAM-dependent rRNA methyltransferase [Deinococcus cellulosilyticus]|uniref:SAM-dependent methyltransferase n=1 Tax=Deinococcus cellulosilyticus (strain DSM 18568 / NBRC 106333 / KACC 11606 / 5516J-15) TaxID=1223518 RepID=A0A511N9Z5_DEIC1|nr:class I SAM-dependent rRNA methyltransferase [Deinococcus cellulosilyticus]GEM49387.1 SAM-dependent methyltransferase [Deinococcus cellulosilyticus NBRC 106333 = KACC 11606]